MFINKTVLITGGTGTIGQFLVEKLLHTNVKRVIVFSRDEEKQFDMQQKYSDSRLCYVIGDIRNQQQIDCAMYGVDYVIHAAAIKQVPIAEKNPVEAVLTNVMGTYNVVLAAINQNAKKVVYISSDKSIAPTNCMGMTKGISERIIRSELCSKSKTEIVSVRLGNVLGARGSVIPLWKKQIRARGKIVVTDKAMTRFIMTTEEVYQLIVHAVKEGKSGEIIFLDMNACSIYEMAKCICMCYGLDYRSSILLAEPRTGEKMYEELFSEEEKSYMYSLNEYYHVGTVKKVEKLNIPCRSNEVNLLTVDEIRELLIQNDII